MFPHDFGADSLIATSKTRTKGREEVAAHLQTNFFVYRIYFTYAVKRSSELGQTVYNLAIQEEGG